MQRWLAEHWVAGAVFMAGLQLALLPALVDAWSLPVLLIYLHGPAYMLHQVEEHRDDRFRHFANARVFGGREVLTTKGVLWINLPGVWGLNLLALLAARLIDPGLGLAVAYLVLINASSHVGMAVRLRATNPGMWTAVFGFAPLGMATLGTVHGSVGEHALGLLAGGGVHASIALGCLRRSVALEAGAAS